MRRPPRLPDPVAIRLLHRWATALRNVGVFDSHHEQAAFANELGLALLRSPWAARRVVRRHLLWAQLTFRQRDQAEQEIDRWWRRHRHERARP